MKSHLPRAIVYSDRFVPREWNEAHGLQPVRHRPRPFCPDRDARLQALVASTLGRRSVSS